MSPQSNDLKARAEEIRMLLAGNHLSSGTKRLLDFATDFASRDSRNEAIVISAARVRIEHQERAGVLDFRTAEEARTKMLYQALALVDLIEEQPQLGMLHGVD